ncbi:MAG TPA: redoxin family protein [Puia sp.]|nr:redoxin family protein [Puia sp.]
MRKFLMIAWITLLLSGIVALFWYTDWKYSLPTPVPNDYHAIQTGSPVYLGKKIRSAPGRSIFLHFFNPSCPCSRFNMPYFRGLVKKYGGSVDFAIVVMSSSHYTTREICEKFGLDLPVYFDSSMAKACGVYSTPQAVIIDSADRLYYRGNYNKSRYCADSKTNYAEIALLALLMRHPIRLEDPSALKAYGCSLPNCKK